MNRQLAALLKAYEDFREASPEKADHLADIYDKRLHEYSEQFGIALQILEQALKTRYLRQVRADEKRPGTLPPRA